MSDNTPKGRKILVFINNKVETAYLMTNRGAGVEKVRTTNGDIEYINTQCCFLTAEHASIVLETKRRWWMNEIRQIKQDLITFINQHPQYYPYNRFYIERVLTLSFVDKYDHISRLRKEIRQFKEFKNGYMSSLKEINNFAHHNDFFTNILKILRKLWV